MRKNPEKPIDKEFDPDHPLIHLAASSAGIANENLPDLDKLTIATPEIIGIFQFSTEEYSLGILKVLSRKP